METQKTGRRLAVLTEWIALFAVMHYCIFRFLGSTTFRFEYSQALRDAAFYGMIAAGALRTLPGAIADFRKASGWKAKLFAVLPPAAVLLSVIPCVFLNNRFGYDFLLYIPLAAFCLYGIEARRVVRLFTVTLLAMLAGTVLCALSGCIRNLIYLREDTGVVRGAYGICFPTDLAAYLVYGLTMLWCCGRKSSWAQTGALAALAVAAAWFMNVYTDSRNSALCALLLAAGILWERLLQTPAFRRRGSRLAGKVTDGAAAAAFPLAAGAMGLLVFLYGKGVPLAERMNQVLSNRLYQAWSAFGKYGLHALGAQTPQAGLGGRIVYDPSAYEFLDSSYALLLIRYGWVFALMVAAAWIWTTRKASKAGYRRIALAMGLIAVHSFAEHHLPEMNFNILLVMPLCMFSREREAEAPAPEKVRAGRKRETAGWIAGAAVGSAFLLLLPRLLSRARSLFNMIDWMDVASWSEMGYKALKPLIGWLMILCALAAAWFVLARGLREVFERKRPSLLTWGLLAAVAIAGAGGMIWVNRHMDLKAPEYREQLAADEAPVRAVLAAAEEPVWAGQMEELYRDRFGGIQYRLFSPEELSRSCRGSILMENRQECYQLMNTGAKYAELSPYTGLFTWDPAVIEKLSGAGYVFRDFFYAEREMDLHAFAVKNEVGLTPGGGMRLRGSGHPLKSGPYLEQYAGNYTVTYHLKFPDTSLVGQDREVCLLRVVTQYGRDGLVRRPVMGTELEEDGEFTISLSYSVGNTRGHEYLVFPRDDIEVWVERIAWRRDS